MGKLVKYSNKSLGELTASEVKEMIRDFLDERYERFSDAALGEFLNEDPADEGSQRLRDELLALEKSIFSKGDKLGLWSVNARKKLELLAAPETAD